ncbi:MAG: PEP-CTERM sorting domain-containing protein [Cyanobacteria bacterium P01_B01_bin.77]
MKQILLAAAAALGVTAFAAPAQAARFQWNVDYTGFFADGASISGFFTADETAATDGFVSGDEFDTWEWTWSGNSEIAAFTLTSLTAEAETFFGDFGFFVDGMANVPGDDASEGVYISDEAAIDLDFLLVDTFTSGAIASVSGNTTASGVVTVSDPEAVPEPATLLGLLTLAGAAVVAKRQKQAT